MAGVRGDFAALKALGRRTAGLGNARFQGRLRKQLAATAQNEVLLGFHHSRDPYGKRWKPISHRDGKPLRDTGRLMNSYTAKATARGFEVGTNVKYASPHQYGAQVRHHKSRRKFAIAQRMMVPEGRLPRSWEREFKRTSDALVRQEMR